MRKFLFFPALLFISTLSFAEAGDDIGADKTANPGMGGLFPHFPPTSEVNSPLKQTFRMVAKRYSTFTDAAFVPIDSTVYKYNDNRGGLPNPEDINNDNHILFDLSNTYRFNTAIFGYENMQQREQYFQNEKVSQLIYKKWTADQLLWKNSERYLYQYDQAGKMHLSTREQWYGALWTNSVHSNLQYDNNKNIIKLAAPTYGVDFAYDQNNKLVQIIDKSFSGSGWENNERKSYTYTGKEISSYILEKWDNGNWINFSRWEYSYDADNNVTKRTEYLWNGTAWTPSFQYSFLYDADNKQTDEIKKIWNSTTSTYENFKQETRTYDTNNLLEEVRTLTWDGQKWVYKSGDISIHYYYQVYYPTDVRALATTQNLNVYPIPASDILHISANWNESAEFTVSLIDVSGRVVYHQTEKATSKYQGSIAVSAIPSGNYALVLSNKYSKQSRIITINR